MAAMLVLAILGQCSALIYAATVTSSSGRVEISGNVVESMAGLPTGLNLTHPITYDTSFNTGTGTGNLDLGVLAVNNTNLAASGSVTYDLASYTNNAGTSVTTVTKVKIIYLKNTGTVSLDVGGAASNAFIGTGWLKDTSDIINVAAGQPLLIVVPAGITVSGTVKNLKVLNTSGATAGSYTLLVAGSSS